MCSEKNPEFKNEPKLFTNQILKHYESLQVLQVKINETVEIQKECIKNISKENGRYKEVYSLFNFNIMFQQVSFYTKKLISLQNDMIMIRDRVERLKHRARTVKAYQEAKQKELQKAKQEYEERERLLIAKPVWEIEQVDSAKKS